jgi:hypothetical protein
MTSRQLENPLFLPFRVISAVVVFILASYLSIFVSPPLVLVPLVGAVLIWAIVRYPIAALAGVLAFMPFDFIAIALGKYFGLPYMTLISACDKEVVLLLLAFLLWRRNGFKLATPDLFLLACFTLAVIRTAFGGTLVGFVTDFAFVIPYFVGRMTVLTTKQEHLWARCAVWIAGILSVLGLAEVFIFGEGPRTLLYLAIDSETEGARLTGSFHGEGLAGLREAATMIGPNGFGALCMVALIIWWVYFRNPLPAAMIAVGLICSVTRAAWVGTAVAIPLLAVIMQEKKRLVLYATVALALFAAAVPVLDLSDYLLANKTGKDSTVDYHRDAILDGLKYAADHPFGSGNTKLSAEGVKQDTNLTIFETTYPYFAAEYGIAASLCFVGFLFSALYLLWRTRSQLGYAAAGILVGMSLVMAVTLPLRDRRLSTWALLPIGMAVQSAMRRATPRVAATPEPLKGETA